MMMKKMMMNRKIAVFFAVFFFSFNTIEIYQVSADAASLVVEGGSLGTMGLNSLGSLFPYAAPIILGMLKQAGMEIKLSQEAQDAGMTKTQYLYDQVFNWKSGAPDAVSYLCERVLTGTSVDAEGIIYVGQIALDAIEQLGNWIVSNAGSNFIDTDAPANGYQTCNFGDIQTFYGTDCTMTRKWNGFEYLHRYHSDVPVAWFGTVDQVGRSITVTAVSPTPFTGYYTNGMSNNLNQMSALFQVNGYYYMFQGYGNSEFINYNPALYLSTTSGRTLVESLSSNFNVNSSADVPDNYFEGTVDGWSDFVPGLSLPAGYTGAIDFGILNQILAELEESKNFEMTVEDYLQAINEAVNDQAVDVPIENVEDGSIAYVPDVVIVPDPAFDPVADPDIPVPEEVTPVIDESEPASFDDLMNQPLTLDLRNFFPFCIPFDLYKLFQKFNAPAVAPHFRINFTIPIVNQQVDYTIDFSPFNDVAAVLRTMELIAMVVLLALATRRIFLRG